MIERHPLARGKFGAGDLRCLDLSVGGARIKKAYKIERMTIALPEPKAVTFGRPIAARVFAPNRRRPVSSGIAPVKITTVPPTGFALFRYSRSARRPAP